MTVACPRHGVIAAAADSPCPDCTVALYDLGDRNALDLVRANRFGALGPRRMVFTVVMAVAGVVLSLASPGPSVCMNVNFVPIIVGVVIGKFLAEPFAKAIEPRPALRALDRFLDAHRV